MLQNFGKSLTPRAHSSKTTPCYFIDPQKNLWSFSDDTLQSKNLLLSVGHTLAPGVTYQSGDALLFVSALTETHTPFLALASLTASALKLHILQPDSSEQRLSYLLTLDAETQTSSGAFCLEIADTFIGFLPTNCPETDIQALYLTADRELKVLTVSVLNSTPTVQCDAIFDFSLPPKTSLNLIPKNIAKTMGHLFLLTDPEAKNYEFATLNHTNKADYQWNTLCEIQHGTPLHFEWDFQFSPLNPHLNQPEIGDNFCAVLSFGNADEKALIFLNSDNKLCALTLPGQNAAHVTCLCVSDRTYPKAKYHYNATVPLRQIGGSDTEILLLHNMKTGDVLGITLAKTADGSFAFQEKAIQWDHDPTNAEESRHLTQFFRTVNAPIVSTFLLPCSSENADLSFSLFSFESENLVRTNFQFQENHLGFELVTTEKTHSFFLDTAQQPTLQMGPDEDSDDSHQDLVIGIMWGVWFVIAGLVSLMKADFSCETESAHKADDAKTNIVTDVASAASQSKKMTLKDALSKQLEKTALKDVYEEHVGVPYDQIGCSYPKIQLSLSRDGSDEKGLEYSILHGFALNELTMLYLKVHSSYFSSFQTEIEAVAKIYDLDTSEFYALIRIAALFCDSGYNPETQDKTAEISADNFKNFIRKHVHLDEESKSFELVILFQLAIEHSTDSSQFMTAFNASTYRKTVTRETIHKLNVVRMCLHMAAVTEQLRFSPNEFQLSKLECFSRPYLLQVPQDQTEKLLSNVLLILREHAEKINADGRLFKDMLTAISMENIPDMFLKTKNLAAIEVSCSLAETRTEAKDKALANITRMWE